MDSNLLVKQLEEAEAELIRLEAREAELYKSAHSLSEGTEAWRVGWEMHDGARDDVNRQRDFIDQIQDEIDAQEISDPHNRQWVEIAAGSSWGIRHCFYEVIGGILILRDEGNHDNLSGNSKAAGMQGLTLQEARDKADSLNSEPRCSQYDGCHWCQWGIRIQEVTEVPRWLTYKEPAKKEIVEAAIAVYNKESGSMGRLKAAIRSLE